MGQVTALPGVRLAALQPANDTASNAQLVASTYLKRLASTTRASARGRLDYMAALLSPGADATTFPWWQLRYEHVVTLRSLLEARLLWRTGNNYIHSLRGILRECWNCGLLDLDDLQRMRDVPLLSGKKEDPAGRYVEDDEWQAFFANLQRDRTPKGVRDLAMFALFRATGIRKAELLSMEVEDLDMRSMLAEVTGKGNKTREVAADKWIRPLLQAWLKLRGQQPGALFCAVYRNGHVDMEHKPLSPSVLHLLLQERIREAGVRRFSLHDFRRNMASNLFDAGIDIGTVMRQGGWERPETAARYDRRPKQRMQAAVTNIPSPFDREDESLREYRERVWADEEYARNRDRILAENRKFDREFDGKPNPWIPDDEDLETGGNEDD